MVSVFTSGYVNTETILHFFYKITNERGTKTVFTYAHIKWFYGQSEGLSLGNGLIQNCMIGIGIGQYNLTGLRKNFLAGIAGLKIAIGDSLDMPGKITPSGILP